MNNIKKTPKIIVLLALAGITSVSANMLAPASYEFNGHTLGMSSVKSSQGAMYLGSWKRLIASKIYPSYFAQLNLATNTQSSNDFPSSGYNSFLFNQNPSGNRYYVVFDENIFSNFVKDSELSFSFASQSLKVSDFEFNQIQSSFEPQQKIKRKQSPLVAQEFYAPGYVLTKGGSSIGISAILIQQSFLDDVYGSVTYNSRTNSQNYNEQAYFETSRGYGFKFNYKQNLFAGIKASMAYQSRIYMSAYDSIGYTYFEPGDFDIPSQYSFALDIPLFDHNKIMLSTENIAYSQTTPLVHAGYSYDFLQAYNNSAIRSEYKLKDLQVYSVMFKQAIGKNFAINLQALSRQQPPATAKIYNNILNKDTAQFSYRVGITQKTALGTFSLSASFANKPILFGRSEFGRLSRYSSRHMEGVLAWNLQF